MGFKKDVKIALKGLAALLGVRLLDPIEVFFLPDSNLFYPINSKAGCSSIKLKLIRDFKPDFNSSFPEIHHVNPAAISNGKLKRLFFYSSNAYTHFAKSKEMVLILNNPYHRIYSCYIDVKKGKNIMYDQPSGLSRWISFSRNSSFSDFVEKVCKIPDHLSDRHFRSQSFYYPASLRTALREAKISKLIDFTTDGENPSAENTNGVHLNANTEKLTEADMNVLKNHRGFQKRYAQDIAIYNGLG